MSKPLDDLLALTTDEDAVAPRLWVHPAYVRQWRPRERVMPDGRVVIEQGLEPSGGFVAAALAILRASPIGA